MMTTKPAAANTYTSSAAMWVSNGFRYWRIENETSEMIASMPEAWTLHYPPTYAKVEIYSVKKGISRFLGYLEGAQLARAYTCFANAFALPEGIRGVQAFWG